MVTFSEFLKDLDPSYLIEWKDGKQFIRCLSCIHRKHSKINMEEKRECQNTSKTPRFIDVFSYISVPKEFLTELCPSELDEWKKNCIQFKKQIYDSKNYFNFKVSQNPVELISIPGFIKLISKIDRDELVEFSRLVSSFDGFEQSRKIKKIKTEKKTIENQLKKIKEDGYIKAGGMNKKLNGINHSYNEDSENTLKGVKLLI